MAVTYDPTIGEQDYEGQGGFGPVGPMGPEGGHKPGDVFQADDGTWVMVDQAGRVVPYRVQPATRPAAPDRVEQNGVVYERQPDGTWLPAQGIPAQAVNNGAMTAGQSAQIGLGYAQLAAQAERDKAQMARWAAEDARDDQKALLERDKWVVAQQDNDKTRMERAQDRLDTLQYRKEERAFKVADLRQRLELTTLQMQESARENAASRAVTQQENAANRAQRASEAGMADKLARDRAIAEYSASPTDVGKVSAFLNRGGASNISTAIGQGETAVNLEPLAALLAPPAQAQQAQQTFLNAAMGAQGGQAGPQTFDQARAAAQAGGWDPNDGLVLPTTGDPALDATIAQDRARGGNAWLTTDFGKAPTPIETNPDKRGTLSFLPQMERGGAVMGDEEMGMDEPDDTFMNGLMKLVHMLGMQPKAIAGEKGKANGETVYSNGDVVVMPDEGEGMDEKMPMMAEGGASFLNPLMQMAQQFQQRVGKTALQRSGFERAPTPIELSDPGTDPFRQQLGAATTAAVTGISPQVFLNELMRIRPRGMQQGYASRTR